MKAHQAEYPIATQCRVLGVSTSGYYAWLKRAPSARSKANAELLEEIKKSHKKSDGTYGAPRIHADLPKEMGASLNRVARVMCDVGIQGVTRRKWTKTTVRDEDERAAPDLVDRDFTATGPDQLWVADITYIPTWAGFLYLAVVMDVWSRRIVGWAMATHLRTELVLDALNMALRQRRRTYTFRSSAYRQNRRPRRSSSLSTSSNKRFASKGDSGPPCGVPSDRSTTTPCLMIPASRNRRTILSRRLSAILRARLPISTS